MSNRYIKIKSYTHSQCLLEDNCGCIATALSIHTKHFSRLHHDATVSPFPVRRRAVLPRTADVMTGLIRTRRRYKNAILSDCQSIDLRLHASCESNKRGGDAASPTNLEHWNTSKRCGRRVPAGSLVFRVVRVRDERERLSFGGIFDGNEAIVLLYTFRLLEDIFLRCRRFGAS